MAQQTVNIGAVANDGTGDSLRVGGDKINDNFTELYANKIETSVIIDEDNMASNSAAHLPTQQSVKAYVDNIIAGLGALTSADIDTLAEINAILTDADLVETTDVIGVQDLYIPAPAMWARTTNGCAELAKTEMATSLLNIQSLDFDQTTQEFAQFTLPLPRKYNNGTITAVFYWTAAAGSGDVQWGISGGAYSNDDALTVALGTPVTVDDTLLATNDLHITSATSAMTLAGTPADADFLAFQISRNPASDTLSGDAKLLGVSLRITTDAAIDA